MTGIVKESNRLSTTRGRKRPVREVLRDDDDDEGQIVSVDEVDLPDSLIKDIFNDEEIHMAADNLLHIRDEDLDEYDESSDGDNSNSFNYSLKDFGLGGSSCSSGASEEGSNSGRGGGGSSGGSGVGGGSNNNSNKTHEGKRRYQRSSDRVGQSQSSGDLEDGFGGNGSEASEKSGQDCSKRKQVLSAREVS